MGGEDAFMNFFSFSRHTGVKPNYLHVAHRRPRKTVPLIIPRVKKSEDTDHLTPPTEAAPVGAASQHRGTRSRSIIPPTSLSGCYGTTTGQLTQSSQETAFKANLCPNLTRSYCQMFDLTMTLHVVTPSILLQVSCSEQILQFPEIAATASFLWGHWRRSHVTQSETRSSEQE